MMQRETSMSDDKTITYGDLKEAPNDSFIGCRNMDCEDYGSHYSATYGDYFMQKDSAPIKCTECEAPMLLLIQIVNESEVIL